MLCPRNAVSFTTDINIAKRFAGSEGVILKGVFPKSKLISSPDLFQESEVLIKGVIKDLEVIKK